MHPYIIRWLKISFFNLVIVASLGLTLRYKISFPLPQIDQKYFLHAHSHFAFGGWITHTILSLMVAWISNKLGKECYKKYRWLIYANLITAYGMLFSFMYQGYGLLSIIFSTLSIFVAYAFAFVFWKDLNRIPQKNISRLWFKAALVFNIISSIGAFTLAFMFATKNQEQHFYLSSIYFYLHFQYNGWFLFSCLGFAFSDIFHHVEDRIAKRIFWIFALACIPNYLLSILWTNFPLVIYIIIIVASLIQFWGWAEMVKLLRAERQTYLKTVHPIVKWILGLSFLAFTIKLFLQAGSTIPSLSKLAYGFRPIIIGYLHLVLLGVISLFLIGYGISKNYLRYGPTLKWGISVFTLGVFANELVLMVQGVCDIMLIPLPSANLYLFYAAIILFTGAFLMAIAKGKELGGKRGMALKH
ncbi:MAG: hypothetical protein JST95_08205 [Bacteroidetes bacterium]|nr:hypothetical protein [Bacteroidota bacterium]